MKNKYAVIVVIENDQGKGEQEFKEEVRNNILDSVEHSPYPIHAVKIEKL